MNISRNLVSRSWLHVFPAKGFRRENKPGAKGLRSKASQAGCRLLVGVGLAWGLTLASGDLAANEPHDTSGVHVAVKLPRLQETFGSARASTTDNRLSISTGKIARTWVLTTAGLRTTRLTNLATGQVWSDQSPFGADWAHASLLGMDAEAELVSLTARESDDEEFTSRHLEVVAAFRYPQTDVELEYRIWVYPEAEGVRTQIWVKGQPREVVQAALPRFVSKSELGHRDEEWVLRALDLPSGPEWSIDLSWEETSTPPEVVLTSMDGEARHTLSSTSTGAKGVLSSDLRLDGTVSVRVRAQGDQLAMTEAWLVGPDGEQKVRLAIASSAIDSTGPGRVESLPVGGVDFRAIGYYNDTQHRHEPELHLLRDESVAGDEIAWASVLMGEAPRGGVAIVKESHKCVNQSGVDTGAFQVGAGRVDVTGWGLGPKDLVPDEWRWAWATWTVLFDAPTDNARQLALKRFDRIRYPQSAALDLYLKANTWGSGIDQPASMIRASEVEILAELESVADLGLDTLQIDDGWQIGRMRKEADPMVEWTVRPDWYPEGWANVVAKADQVGVDLGIWHAARAPLDALKRNWDEGHFKTWKLDFANLSAYAGVNDYLGKGRAFVTYTDHTVRVNWDVTENAPRFGYFWARECGNIWLANRKPLQPANVVPRPWLMLREAWELAHYLNSTKFELPIQNFRMVNREVSDAYLHSDTYSVALGLSGIPVFFQTTRLLEEDQREEIKALLQVYREHRRALFESFVFPVGDEPSNRSWSGFQWMNPEGGDGFALLFRERLNEEPTKRVALRFIAPGSRVRLTDLRTGESSLQQTDSQGRIEVTLATAGDVQFLEITPL